MKLKIKMVLTAVLMFSFVAISSAMVVNNRCEADDEVTNVSGNFDEDYLFMGDELRFSGSAEDLIFLGRRLSFDGTAKLGLISICRNLVFTGEAGNGIIATGVGIDINGKVKGNNFVLCKTLHLNEAAVVDGNLFTLCAKLIIDGVVTGDLYAGAGEIVINNEINGNVKACGGRIVLGEKGKINGDLTYGAKEKIKPEDLKKISGTVRIDEKHKVETPEVVRKNWMAFRGFVIIALIVSFLGAGCLLLLLPVFSKLESSVLTERIFWHTGLWGLIPLLMYPALIVISFILVVTIPFAFILMFAVVPLFFITQITGLTLLGRYTALKFKWKIRSRYLHFLIGASTGVLLSIIPVVNMLVTLFISGLGSGLLIMFLFNKRFSDVPAEVHDRKNGELEAGK